MATEKIKIEVKKGDVNRALKQFKRKVMDSGHLQELRDRKQYTKPTTARRKQKLQAIRQNKLNLLNENEDI